MLVYRPPRRLHPAGVPAVVAVDTERSEVRVIECYRRIAPVVRRQPDHVMDVFGRSIPALLQTVLTERVRLQVRCPASLPGWPVIKGFWNGPGH